MYKFIYVMAVHKILIISQFHRLEMSIYYTLSKREPTVFSSIDSLTCSMWKEEPAAKLDLDSEAMVFSLRETHQNDSSSSAGI